MEHKQWVIIEYYKDGGVWKHFYPHESDARRDLPRLRAANVGRIYELHQAEKS